MLYDKEKKLLFIHIPKNGGNTVATATDFKYNTHLGKHAQISEIELEHKLDEYYKFAVVRNPWDRVVSMYYYFKKFKAIGDVEFKSWLLNNNTTHKSIKVMSGKLIFDKNAPGHYDEPFQTKTQLSWLKDSNGVVAVDFICRLEHLSHDMKNLGTIKNTNYPIEWLNKTKHPNYIKVHDQETIDFVSQYYKDDIDYFGFDFDSAANKNFLTLNKNS